MKQMQIYYKFNNNDLLIIKNKNKLLNLKGNYTLCNFIFQKL